MRGLPSGTEQPRVQHQTELWPGPAPAAPPQKLPGPAPAAEPQKLPGPAPAAPPQKPSGPAPATSSPPGPAPVAPTSATAVKPSLQPSNVPVDQHFAITWAFDGATDNKKRTWLGRIEPTKPGTKGRRVEYTAERGLDDIWRPIFNNRHQPVVRSAPWPPAPDVLVACLELLPTPPHIVYTPPEVTSLPAPESRKILTQEASKRTDIKSEHERAWAKFLPAYTAALKKMKPVPTCATVAPQPPSKSILPRPLSAAPKPSAPAVSHVEQAPSPAIQPKHVTHDADDELADLEEMVGWWDGTNLQTAIAGFQGGHGTLPPVAQVTKEDTLLTASMPASTLVNLIRGPTVESRIPTLAKQGLVHTTQLEHKRMLLNLCQIPDQLLSAPATTAIIEHLTLQSNHKKWRASTLLKYLATAQGCLHLLPLYRHAPQILLNRCPVWQQAMRGAQIRARQELPRQPKPATWEQVEQVIRTHADATPALATAILITWLTAARTGCVLQLDVQDVTLTADASLAVRFRRGKGARIRGPYTVHTKVPPQWTALLSTFLQQSTAQRLFTTVTGPSIKTAMRTAHPSLEQRSLRRGALQTLSCAPHITDNLLMEFSGHTCVKTLRRYLSWGSAAPYLQNQMRHVAATMHVPKYESLNQA